MENTKLLTAIPHFWGFYNGYDELLQETLERDWDFEGCGEPQFPDNIDDILYTMDGIDWAPVFKDFASYFVAHLSGQLERESGGVVSLTYESMQSPREYNFATDRVFVHITLQAAEYMLKNTDKKTLADLVHDRFSSRDGFISFYSNDVADWLATPLSNWDCNQLEALLSAYMYTTQIVSENDENQFGWSVWEDYDGNGEASEAIFNSASEEYKQAYDAAYTAWEANKEGGA